MKKAALEILTLGLIFGTVYYGLPRVLSHFLKSAQPIAAITSGSMWPVLKQGDLVFIKGVGDKKEIKVGDIVVYQNDLGFTIHRVVRMYGDKIVTRGDANNTDDTPIKFEQIAGKVLGTSTGPVRIPLVGSVSAAVRKN